MSKPESITIRVTPEFKAIVIKRAQEENRSITSYLEWLVLCDSEPKREPKPKNRRG